VLICFFGYLNVGETMKRRLLPLFILSAFACATQAAPVTIDFEGVVPDNQHGLDGWPYSEDGMIIDSQRPALIFGKDFTTSGVPLNDNGSAIFGWCNNPPSVCYEDDLITIRGQGGSAFDLSSLDASNLYIGLQISNYFVVGNFSDGRSSIATTLSLQLDTWTTYTFDSAWTGLESVTITADGIRDAALDNIVVNVVPLPATIWLFGSALAGIGWLRRRAL